MAAATGLTDHDVEELAHRPDRGLTGLERPRSGRNGCSPTLLLGVLRLPIVVVSALADQPLDLEDDVVDAGPDICDTVSAHPPVPLVSSRIRNAAVSTRRGGT